MRNGCSQESYSDYRATVGAVGDKERSVPWPAVLAEKSPKGVNKHGSVEVSEGSKCCSPGGSCPSPKLLKLRSTEVWHLKVDLAKRIL